jgi:hypothetical protein
LRGKKEVSDSVIRYRSEQTKAQETQKKCPHSQSIAFPGFSKLHYTRKQSARCNLYKSNYLLSKEARQMKATLPSYDLSAVERSTA